MIKPAWPMPHTVCGDELQLMNAWPTRKWSTGRIGAFNGWVGGQTAEVCVASVLAQRRRNTTDLSHLMAKIDPVLTFLLTLPLSGFLSTSSHIPSSHLNRMVGSALRSARITSHHALPHKRQACRPVVTSIQACVSCTTQQYALCTCTCPKHEQIS